MSFDKFILSKILKQKSKRNQSRWETLEYRVCYPLLQGWNQYELAKHIILSRFILQSHWTMTFQVLAKLRRLLGEFQKRHWTTLEALLSTCLVKRKCNNSRSDSDHTLQTDVDFFYFCKHISNIMLPCKIRPP